VVSVRLLATLMLVPIALSMAALNGCIVETGATAPEAAGNAPAPTSIPTIALTTPTPSPTPTAPQATRTPKPPTPTTAPVPSTPSPREEGPESGDGTLSISADAPGTTIVEIFEPQILDFLNSGGSPESLRAALAEVTITQGKATWHASSQATTIDVTGDEKPDVVVDLSFFEIGQYTEGAIFVFTCEEGRYQGGAVAQIAGQVLSEGEPDPTILAIEDMNGNGMSDIVFSYIEMIGTHANFTRVFRIVEWDGAQFADLIRGDPSHPHAAAVNNGDGAIGDTDGDGILELALTHGVGHYYADGGPQRPRTDTWAWDGSAYALAGWEYAPPTYRFQAVQDGDRALQLGNYDEALESYRRALSDEALLGWSQGQLWPDSAYGEAPTPTPDPKERPRLNAYALYRIMLLHVIQGDLSQAQLAYQSLQEGSPPDAAGNQYAQLATAFWTEYQATEDVAAACSQAVEYAAAHSGELLDPMGSGFYGMNQRDYVPEDICPFG
jgi:hypothetical protein